jgi:hypothetical protein
MKTLHRLSYSKVTLCIRFCGRLSTTPPSKAIQGLQVLNFAQGGCKVIPNTSQLIDAAFTLNDHLPSQYALTDCQQVPVG